MRRRLHVVKSSYRLMVMEDLVIVKDYPIAIGERADGKACVYTEDFRTPEGKFSVESAHFLSGSEAWFANNYGSNLIYYPFYLAHKWDNIFADAGRNVYGSGRVILSYPRSEDLTRYNELLKSGEVKRDWHAFLKEKWEEIFVYVSREQGCSFEEATLSRRGKTRERSFLDDKTFWDLYNSIPPPPTHGLAIHGTNDPACISHKISGGCIRMHNQDLRELISNFVDVGMEVIIEN